MRESYIKYIHICLYYQTQKTDGNNKPLYISYEYSSLYREKNNMSWL